MCQQTAGRKIANSVSVLSDNFYNRFQRLNVLNDSMEGLGLFDFVHCRFFSGGVGSILC